MKHSAKKGADSSLLAGKLKGNGCSIYLESDISKIEQPFPFEFTEVARTPICNPVSIYAMKKDMTLF